MCLLLLIICWWYLVEEDGQDHFSRFHMRRRSKLPMPKVESDVSVWSLLCKNIGKDLSKISMPVSMNEPLNALQVRQQLQFLTLIPGNYQNCFVLNLCTNFMHTIFRFRSVVFIVVFHILCVSCIFSFMISFWMYTVSKKTAPLRQVDINSSK